MITGAVQIDTGGHIELTLDDDVIENITMYDKGVERVFLQRQPDSYEIRITGDSEHVLLLDVSVSNGNVHVTGKWEEND